MNKLKELRIKNGKTQKELADFLNISDVAYYYYESGKREMSPDTILKLAQYFNVTTDYLLGKEDSKHIINWDIQRMISALTPNPFDKSTIDSKKIIYDILEKQKYYMCAVYGKISAGQPNWAEECIEGRIPIDCDMMNIVNPEEHFFLRVDGESMNKVIRNGAFALIHKQDYVENGEIAVVLVNGFDATLKHFTKQGDTVILSPDSTDNQFTMQVYDKTTPIKILGKYIGKMEINSY